LNRNRGLFVRCGHFPSRSDFRGTVGELIKL
jgi:hypothetical protein